MASIEEVTIQRLQDEVGALRVQAIRMEILIDELAGRGLQAGVDLSNLLSPEHLEQLAVRYPTPNRQTRRAVAKKPAAKKAAVKKGEG